MVQVDGLVKSGFPQPRLFFSEQKLLLGRPVLLQWIKLLVYMTKLFEGQIVLGGLLYRGAFGFGWLIVPGGILVWESFYPRWLFDRWLMVRWLLSWGFLRGAFDRIPKNTYRNSEGLMGWEATPHRAHIPLRCCSCHGMELYLTKYLLTNAHTLKSFPSKFTFIVATCSLLL